MNLGFYQDYDKRKHSDLTQYKICFLKSVITDDTVYKFIAFDENEQLNLTKLECLKNNQLWFSYYKFLNDRTEFDIKYDILKTSSATGVPCEAIQFFIATMKEIQDVCSMTYSYNNYMWDAYGNYGNGICLIFKVTNYDMLYPVEYVDKNAVDYTDMLIELFNLPPKELFDNGMKIAELPYVIKNPENDGMKSYLEKEIRILTNPFDDGILNFGSIYPGVKNANNYKRRNVYYNKCGLAIDKIVIGKNCDKAIVNNINDMDIGVEIIYQK